MCEKRADSLIQSLHQIPSFQTLPEHVLGQTAKKIYVRQLDCGHLLFSEGAEARWVYFVVQGSFKSVRHAEDGREQVISVERKDAILGVASVFLGGNYLSTMVTTEPTKVLAIETGEMVRLCRAHPEVLWNVASILARCARDYAELAATLSLRNVSQRLARYLLTIGEDRGVKTEEGLAFELAATRPDIATQLGSVREVVSRSFAQLQEQRLIVLKGRLVIITDWTALKRFSHHEKSARASSRS